MTTPAASSLWPFTRREEELRRIVHGRGSFVLAGAAGVGKSRLAAEAASRLAGTHTVLRINATEATRSLPLGAAGPLLPPDSPPANLLGWAAKSILDSVGGSPAVLLVDDAHLLDAASAALVHQLAPHERLRVLVTVRTGEPCPDPVTALWKDDLAERIELAPFTFYETELALSRALDGIVDRDVAQRLHHLSQGNVLFLRELVLAGTVQAEDGRWRWGGGVPIGGRLAELIDARLGELYGAELDAAELTAFGEPLGLHALTGLTSREAVEALEARQIVEVFDGKHGSVLRLAHPLYAEAIRGRCPSLRTQRRYGQLADAIEAAGPHSREETLRLALWRLESGTGHDPAPLLAACRLAWAAHDYPLAERFGQAAYEAGGGLDAALLLATVLNYSEQAAKAEAVLAAVWDHDCGERMRTLLTLTRVHNLAWGGLGWQANAERLIDEVEPTLNLLENQQEIMILRGVMATSRGDFTQAQQLSDLVLERPCSRPLWAQGMLVRSWAQVYTGRFHDGIATAAQALQARHEWQEQVPPIIGSFHAGIIDAHRFAGDLDALEAAIEVSHAETADGGGWNRGVYHDRMIRGIALRLHGLARQAAGNDSRCRRHPLRRVRHC